MEKLNQAVNNIKIVVSNTKMIAQEHAMLISDISYVEELAREALEAREAKEKKQKEKAAKNKKQQ